MKSDQLALTIFYTKNPIIQYSHQEWKAKCPSAPLADAKHRKTLLLILQVWGTELLHNLRGLVKELDLTSPFRPESIFS
uniref:Uncharacterized protein n=1 Tax=Romanomermis culicivorax TaxID=13658 RepID=A0A915L660_ROMCU